MAVEVRCPKCRSWYAAKRGGGEVCTKCDKLIPRGERVYRLRQREKQTDGSVVRRTKYLGLQSRASAELLSLEAKQAARQKKPVSLVWGIQQEKTWQDLVDAYLNKLEAEGRNSMYQQDSRRYLDRMSEFWGLHLPVDQLNKDKIQDFRVFLLSGKAKGAKRKPSQAYCDRHLAAGKAAWEYSVPDSPNPFKSVKFFNPRNEVTRYLSKDQRDKLLKVAFDISRDLAAIIYIGLPTGLRKSNILNLRRDQVDFEKSIMTVTQKGGRSHSISIGSSVMKVLGSIPDNGTPYFWVGQGGTPYHVDWRRPWKKAKKLAGIPDDFRFHDLRHDAGTSILRETGSLKLAKEVLGHRDIRTTERYAHVMQEQVREAIESISPLGTFDADLEQKGPSKGPS